MSKKTVSFFAPLCNGLLQGPSFSDEVKQVLAVLGFLKHDEISLTRHLEPVEHPDDAAVTG